MSKTVSRVSRVFHLLLWLAMVASGGGDDIVRFLNNGHDDKV
jgi:hypothetical protein